jgi:AAA15 family ATPase/GTPase
MKNFIHDLEIKNFKSIKHMKTGCKRVNVFIGEPNVGKSNILEAIGLFGAGYSTNSDKILGEFIRYQEISNLFYDDDLQLPVEVTIDASKALLRFQSNNMNVAELFVGEVGLVHKLQAIESSRQIRETVENLEKPKDKEKAIVPYYIAIQPDGSATRLHVDILTSFQGPIRKYEFKLLPNFANKFPFFLLPPHGSNFFSIIHHDKELRKEIAEIFGEYGLRFVADQSEGKFEIQKLTDEYYVNRYHYASIADTFQRLFFYYAAIDSNKDAVLILEEPEVHSYPPYTKNLAERIVASKENQFFITTHSPYILQNLVSDVANEELNVFITYYENYETKIKCLSPDELRRVSGHGIDLFFNLAQFLEK